MMARRYYRVTDPRDAVLGATDRYCQFSSNESEILMLGTGGETDNTL